MTEKKIKNKLEVSIKSADPLHVLVESFSSIVIKKGTKGNIDFEVKIYNQSPKQAFEEAKAIFKDLQKEYPHES